MEKCKPLRASHFPTHPTATDLLTRPLRYTNNLSGRKDWQTMRLFAIRNAVYWLEHEDVLIFVVSMNAAACSRHKRSHLPFCFSVNVLSRSFVAITARVTRLQIWRVVG